MQAFTEEQTATFNFYGTKDERKVSYEGPFTGNSVKAPPDEIVYTTGLSVGERKQTDKPHDGFDVTWYRVIKRGGEEVREKIFSRYKALPAKILVGGEPPAEQKTDVEIEAARAFE